MLFINKGSLFGIFIDDLIYIVLCLTIQLLLSINIDFIFQVKRIICCGKKYNDEIIKNDDHKERLYLMEDINNDDNSDNDINDLDNNQRKINIIFRTNKNSPINAECFVNEKVSDIIQRYRNKALDFDYSKKFIFNAKSINPNLSSEEAGLTNNSNIFVVKTIRKEDNDTNGKINVIFLAHRLGGEFQEIAIVECFPYEKISDIIQKYRKRANDYDDSKNFIFNAKILSKYNDLSAEKVGLINNSKIIVYDPKIQNEKSKKKINIIFIYTNDLDKYNKEIIMECYLYEKIIDIINRFRIQSHNFDYYTKFIYNAKTLNLDLSAEESGLINNSKIFMVKAKEIQDKSQGRINIIFRVGGNSGKTIGPFTVECFIYEKLSDVIQKYRKISKILIDIFIMQEI